MHQVKGLCVKRKDLASLLGISPAMVTKLAGRGMPTTDAAAARAWRAEHLDLVRTKAYRTGGNDGGRRRQVRAVGDPAEAMAYAALARVEQLARLAQSMLTAGQFAAIERDLRAALAGVPGPHRDRVRIACQPAPDATEAAAEPGQVSVPLAVWDALVMPVAALLPCAEVAEGSEAAPMADDEAQEMGRFWYAVAAGEVLPMAGGSA